MSTRDEDLDEQLRRYLEREEHDPVRTLLHNMGNQIFQMEKDNATRYAEFKAALDGHHFRLQSLEHKAQKIEDEVENTGRHNLESIRARAKRYEDVWWTALKLTLLALLAGGVVEFVHRVAGH